MVTHRYVTIEVRELEGAFSWAVLVAGVLRKTGTGATYWGAHRKAAEFASLYE